jgi:ribosome modulation factor
VSNKSVNNTDPYGDGMSGRPDQPPHEFAPDTDPATDRAVTRPRQSPMAGWLGSAAVDLLGHGLVLATQDQGYAAAWNGDHVNACPWRSAETDRDLALRQMWIRGYAAGRTDLRTARDPDQPAP